MKYYSAIKKNEFLPFATTWMDLEDIMLSEIIQTEKGQTLYVEYKNNKLVNMTKKKKKKNQTDS